MRNENEFLNEPVSDAYRAEIRYDGLRNWICCPYCGKKQFPLTPGSVIHGQFFKCRGSSCKQMYEVDTGEPCESH